MFLGASRLNGHLEVLLNYDDLLAFTVLASILLFHYLTLPSTLTTLHLSLSVHSGTQLSQLCDKALPLAFRTFLDTLASLTFARLANSCPLDLDVLHDSVVNLFQSDD